ncbi:Cation efflux family [Mycena indigotica]|uniref:Cation efflux family n=1 Tax=Mycena indigotica TaxID=2126181 RepID=A0A8H6TF86_9AGAR|nr:Cation efflux family [Mycena indigotica]KAF7315612.1 Cation efflux family [Mycena indigotica]
MQRRNHRQTSEQPEPHSHSHSHSHSVFSPSHSHGTDSAERIMAAFRGAGDRGSQITLVGLFANIGESYFRGLTAIKGAAGYLTHSAALIADAGHSASDLVGDLVTLACWRISRRPPTNAFPYGFAKFETLGTTTVSIFLIAGAAGLGLHSYHLLLHSLVDTSQSLPTGPLQEALTNITSIAPALHTHGHAHSHSHGVDPNALWFAALGILSKEWLYRITKSVAQQENSSVLLANAYHHRSDSYGSMVAFCAILGNWWWPALPLDPIGGLLVSLIILQNGASLLFGAWGDITDAGIPPSTRNAINDALTPLLASSHSSESSPSLLGLRHIRGRRAGSLIFVDLTAEVPKSLSVDAAIALEEQMTQTLKAARKEVGELRVRFHVVDQ